MVSLWLTDSTIHALENGLRRATSRIVAEETKRIAFRRRMKVGCENGLCGIGGQWRDACGESSRIVARTRVRAQDACVQFSSDGNALRSCRGEEDEEAERDCIERIRAAIGVDESFYGTAFWISGTQTLLAMEGKWQLNWRNDDGRFWEQFDGVEMTLECGFDGEGQNSWAVGAAGIRSTLELDDREVCLLGAWIRTGYWVTEAARTQIHVRLVQGDVAGVAMASWGEITLSVQLRDCKVVAYVVVDATTMYPLRASMKAFGGWNKWQYSDWKPVVAGQGYLFPFSCTYTQASGNEEVYSVVEICSVESIDEVVTRESPFSSHFLSNLLIVPRPRGQNNHPHVDFDSSCPPDVQMLRTDSGHYLVQPLVNGKTVGYFIVDTGASGLIISPQKARELNLTTFGEIHITGVNGVVKSQYCRANTFQLGPLRITNPMFLEIPVSGIVRGDPLVVGMCGFDMFAQCIVEMAHDEGRLSLFDPALYSISCSKSLQWHTLRFLENIPHVSATFNGHDALFLIDTGAGGVDVIFHKRAVEEFGLLKLVQVETYAELMGINASGKGVEVILGTLNQLAVAGKPFKQTTTMLARENVGNLDTSEYVAGLLCGDLLTKCRVVFNYAQRQLAITTQT